MSLRITQTILQRGVLSDLEAAGARLSDTQRQLASGKQINRPSDDPFGTSRALGLRSDLEATQQYQRNTADGRAWTDITDTALGNITDAAQRARELLIAGGNDAGGQAARSAQAAEIDGLIDSIKQEANANVGGRFVFAGTATTTQPYAIGGADGYAGDANAIAREIGPGVSVAVNATGGELLGSGGTDGKLLSTLRTIAAHLRGGTAADGAALRSSDLQALDANLDTISTVRTRVGATANRIDVADRRLADLETSTTQLLSETEDVDMAKAMTDFSMQQAVYQSALRAGANVVQNSLLDFLR